MNIFTKFRTIFQLGFAFLALLLTAFSGKAQFCLAFEERADEMNPDEVFLDVTTNEFENIAAMQFSLLYDPDVYEFIGLVEANLNGFNEGSFALHPQGVEGVISMAWYDLLGLGVTFTEDKPLVTFKMRKLSEDTVPFTFSDEPTPIEVSTISEVFYNFENCITGENLSPAMQGQLYIDENEDCAFESSEITSDFINNWSNWTIISEKEGKYFLSSRLEEDGTYDLKLFQGLNQVEILLPSPYFEACEPIFEFDANDLDLTEVIRSPIQINEFCPYLEISLNSYPRKPCEEIGYYVEFTNNGTAKAENVYIELDFDYRLIISSISDGRTGLEVDATSLGNNQYRVDIGNLTIGERGGLFVGAQIPCELSEEEMLRNEARIYPNEICGTLNENWSGASLRVNGQCDGEQVIFELKNVGNGDMVQPLEYIVIEDGVIFRSERIQLPRGGKETITLAANGMSYFVQVPQEPGHPGTSKPSAFIEACGRTENNDFSTGFANRFPEENNDLFVDVDYQLLSDFNNRNRILASPIGYSDKHLIDPQTPIEYTTYFTNFGAALEIVDTLSPFLDVTTFKALSANSPYEYTLEEGVLKIQVPPSAIININDRSGYVKYSIEPRSELPMGTVIENTATLYFNEDRVETTNTVFHTIEEDFLDNSVSTTFTPTPTTNLSIYPNPSTDVVLFTLRDWKPTNYQLNIFNVDGKIVQTTTFNSNTYRFEKGDLPGGTYLYRLVGENGAVDNGFFILID